MEYFEILPSLRDINLEDSWVLSILDTENETVIAIEAVLSKKHPLYECPATGMARCYRNAILKFERIEERRWLRRSERPNIGPEGEVDYGNIDFIKKIDKVWSLGGEWGDLEIECGDVSFTII